jgi:hypothetical protein
MSILNFDVCLRRMPIGLLPTGLNGVFTLNAARSSARERAVR